MASLCSHLLDSAWDAPLSLETPPQPAGFSKEGEEPSRAVYSLKTFPLLPWARSSLGQGPRRIMRVRYQKVLLVLSPSDQPIRGQGNQTSAEEVDSTQESGGWEGMGRRAGLALPIPP